MYIVEVYTLFPTYEVRVVGFYQSSSQKEALPRLLLFLLLPLLQVPDRSRHYNVMVGITGSKVI